MSRASLEKKPHEVAAMFDAVAKRYDLINDLSSLGQDRFWRSATLKAIKAERGDRVLDVAAGTGTSSEPLADRGVEVIACDFSIGMLSQGASLRPDLDFVGGDATKLPFADESFDAVTISFALRNVVDVPAALAEMARVTKPGGRLVICEFSRPTFAPLRVTYRQYLTHAMPLLAKASSNPDAYNYLAESILSWPPQEELGRTIRRSGWGRVQYLNLTGGIVALHRATKPLA